MKTIENWFTIEPTKGYVTKKDYEIIKDNLNTYLKAMYTIIKKRKFILIKVNSIMTTKELSYILKNKEYSKAYEITKIADESRFIYNNTFKITIGIPY